jgi:site-specific DNA recombinase
MRSTHGRHEQRPVRLLPVHPRRQHRPAEVQPLHLGRTAGGLRTGCSDQGPAKLDTSGYEPATTTHPEADIVADEKDREKLKELKELWLNDDDFTTADFKAMRAPIVKRMKERQRKTVKRPIAVLDGIAGPEAEASWERLEKAEDFARMNAIYRFLFAAVIVRPPTRRGRGFDTDRVEIKPNPLD